MELLLQCRLLSPVVLTSAAATEGFHPSLDYLPGSLFLGIMAKHHYAKKANDLHAVLDLFHNGTVRYGDAHLTIDEKYSYPTPFSWYRKKVEAYAEPKVYLHHLIGETAEQLKQQRRGYINSDGTQLRKIDQQFSIKSAYEADRRKSLDENMYGYHALPAGLTFLLRIGISGPRATEYISTLRDTLIGKHQIGRSRSAEYGMVEISEAGGGAFQLPGSTAPSHDRSVFYAASNWCFHDEYGFPTTQLKPEYLGLQSGRIDWAESQLRFRRYQSFNSHRRNLNPAAMIVEKGSVLVMKDVRESLNPEYFVGNWRAEGFGQCLVNPEFLTGDRDGLRAVPKEAIAEPGKVTRTLASHVDLSASTTQIIQLVDYRIERARQAEDLQQAIADHEHAYQGISNSQWGMLRGIAKTVTSETALLELLFAEPTAGNTQSGGILRRGQAENNWKCSYRHLKTFLEQVENPLLALDRLADKYQKQTNG